MRILFVNEITNTKGGVESLVEKEIFYLKKNNVEVELYSIDHKIISQKNYFDKLISVLGFFLMKREFLKLKRKVSDFNPDIIHFHNIYPFWGYPIWKFKFRKKIKIVQHLHNFNPFCLNSFFFRDGKTCTLCLDKKHFSEGLVNKCYNNSYSLSLLSFFLRTSPNSWIKYSKNVDIFIGVSKSVKDVYVNAGLSHNKIITLPNAIRTTEKVKYNKGSYVLYLGNIVVEKGVDFVCKLAEFNPQITFKVAGNGRDYYFLQNKYRKLDNLHFVGYVSGLEKKKLLNECRLVIVPSLCWESFGIVILEAFNYGKPVLTTGIGGIKELVKHNVTGKIVKEINMENLNKQLQDLWFGSQEKYDNYYNNCISLARNYSIQYHIDSLKQIYHKLLGI